MKVNLDAVWGKNPEAPAPYPLTRHLVDTYLAAGAVWDHWLRPGLRSLLAEVLTDGDKPEARAWVQQAAALHDVGKANPAFQLQESDPRNLVWREEVAASLRDAGLDRMDRLAASAVQETRAARRHEYVGHVMLTGSRPENVQDLASGWLPQVVAGHHGRWINASSDDEGMISRHLCCGRWADFGEDIITEIGKVTGRDHRDAPVPQESDAGLVITLVTGLVILADWIASSDQCVESGTRLLAQGTDLTGWVPGREEELTDLVVSTLGRYSQPDHPLRSVLGEYSPRPLQKQSINLSGQRGLWLVAQPTGEGKTESALLRHMATDHQEGIIFALPTRATTDAMQARMETMFAGSGNAVVLSHQLAARHESHTSGAAYETDWYNTSIRRLIAPVATATVDQVLSGSLRGKHSALRLLALANKHVVVDEVHTLDHYQTSLLTELLSWWGRTGTRVTLLSATLPDWQRRELEQAYAGSEWGALPYPGHRIIGESVETTATSMSALSPDLHFVTDEASSRSGHLDVHVQWATRAHQDHPRAHIGIVVNTVDLAIDIAREMSKIEGVEVICLHSRMTAQSRSRVESRLTERLGKTAADGIPVILVGTQVVEASLDIDLDLMSTDLAPAPSLIQRAGRLWRFRDGEARSRRLPGDAVRTLHVVRGVSGLPYLDGELDRVWNAIRSNPTVRIPEDVQPLVDGTAFDMSAWGESLADPKANVEMGDALKRLDEANRSKAKISTDLLDDWGVDYTTLVAMTERDISEDLMSTRFIDRPSGTFLLVGTPQDVISLHRDRKACVRALGGMVPAGGAVGHALAAASVETLGGQEFNPRWKALSGMQPVARTVLDRHGLHEDPLLGLVRDRVQETTHPEAL